MGIGIEIFGIEKKLPLVACFELGYNKTLTHRTQFYCKFVKIRIVLQFWRLGGHRFRVVRSSVSRREIVRQSLL